MAIFYGLSSLKVKRQSSWHLYMILIKEENNSQATIKTGEPGMEIHIYNFNAWKAEAGQSPQLQASLALYSKKCQKAPTKLFETPGFSLRPVWLQFL